LQPLLTGLRRRSRVWKTGIEGVGFGARSEFLRATRGLRRGAAEMVNLAPSGRNR
jgi:hypothetical protein